MKKRIFWGAIFILAINISCGQGGYADPPPTEYVPPAPLPQPTSTEYIPPAPQATPTEYIPPAPQATPTEYIPLAPVPTQPLPSIDNLLAYYSLNGTNIDSKGNYPSLNMGNATYLGDGIYCDGVAYNCMQTPPIYDLDYQNFSISADFMVNEYPQHQIPVFVGGRFWRWIGFNLNVDGTVGLLYNNLGDVKCQGTYSPNTWYNALITYDGYTGMLFLDNQLMCSETFTIDAGGGNEDKDISTSNFSNATAFKGFIRNLKIYRFAITP